MFARYVSMKLNAGCAIELARMIENDIMPLLRRQRGFLDQITFVSPECSEAVTISFWQTREDEEAFKRAYNSEVLKKLLAATVETPIELDAMSELPDLGMTKLLLPPFEGANTFVRIWRVLEQKRQSNGNSHLPDDRCRSIIGQNPGFLKEVEKLQIIARYDVNVLIIGETGTGKELFAKAIHCLSPRNGKDFIPVSCGAIPVDLLENELFGHERGAFTSASNTQIGLINQADGGTLFLDEVDCLPLSAQVKFLRFLQEKEYRPLGSVKMQPANVRVIAASNIDLEAAVKAGRLRQDLFYRLNVLVIKLPALRKRREDILLLARHFLDKYVKQFNKPAMCFSPGALLKLWFHDWPGNVRELEHVVSEPSCSAIRNW